MAKQRGSSQMSGVHLLAPGRPYAPVGFNPLENVPPDERWKVTADIVSLFSDIWKLGPETPRLLYYLRASIRLLLDNPNTTLQDIRRVLADDKYRARLLRKCTDKETRQTWTEFEAKDARQQAGNWLTAEQGCRAGRPVTAPIRSRTADEHYRLRESLKLGTVFIIDLSDLGDEPAAILGAIIINAFKQAADAVGDPARPYRLYIDEFQNFGTSIISTILSESRKRGLFLTLAHQFISQLDAEIQDAVLGNCSTIISFRVGPNDAPIIGKAINHNPKNLQELGLGEARMRTLINGRTTDPPLIQTTVPDLETGYVEGNIRNTAANFARTRKDVEGLLNKPAADWRDGWSGRRNGGMGR